MLFKSTAIVAMLLTTSTLFAQDISCSNKSNFCIDDTVIYRYAQTSQHLFAKVEKIENEVNRHFSNGEIPLEKAVLVFEDGSKEKVRVGKYTVVKAEGLPECLTIEGLNNCVGDNTKVMDSSAKIQDVKVVAFMKSEYSDHVDLIGVTEDHKVITSTRMIHYKGEVPGMNGLEFNQKFPNSFGSHDFVDFSYAGLDLYSVYIGELGKNMFLKKQQLEMRINGTKEVELKDSGSVFEISKSLRPKTHISDLKKRAQSFLEIKCNEKFPAMGVLSEVQIELSEISKSRKLTSSAAHGMITLIDPHYELSANYEASARCTHQFAK